MTSASRHPRRTAGSQNQDGYTLTVIGAEIIDEFLCLQYSLSPVPAVLVADRTLHEGDDAGLAIDSTAMSTADRAAPTARRPKGTG